MDIAMLIIAILSLIVVIIQTVIAAYGIKELLQIRKLKTYSIEKEGDMVKYSQLLIKAIQEGYDIKQACPDNPFMQALYNMIISQHKQFNKGE